MSLLIRLGSYLVMLSVIMLMSVLLRMALFTVMLSVFKLDIIIAHDGHFYCYAERLCAMS
jgi:hypothetical protein